MIFEDNFTSVMMCLYRVFQFLRYFLMKLLKFYGFKITLSEGSNSLGIWCFSKVHAWSIYQSMVFTICFNALHISFH